MLIEKKNLESSSALNSVVTKMIQYFPQQFFPYLVDLVLPPSFP